MGKHKNSTRIGAAALGAATVAAGIALATGPALGGVLDAGKRVADATLIGQDDDNTANPAIQPDTVDPNRNQSLRNGDLIAGARGDDTLIGRLGPDVLRGRDGDDVLIGGIERGSDVAAFPNFDYGFGQKGDDIFIWAPGDGSDAFVGGESPRYETSYKRHTIRVGNKRIRTFKRVRERVARDNDYLVFGTMPLVEGDNTQPVLRRTKYGNLPSVNVSGRNLPATVGTNPALPTIRGYCRFEEAPSGSSFDFLVRFFVEPPQGEPFQAVTLRTKDVENVLCRTRGQDTITQTFLGENGNGPAVTRTTDFRPRAGTKIAALLSDTPATSARRIAGKPQETSAIDGSSRY